MTVVNGLDRRTAVAQLLQDRGSLLLVTGLGSPSWDAAAAGDHAANFYLWGGMGNAAMVGLGLAMAQPTRPVLVLTGDGEMLMGLGSLATIAVKAPANLTIAVLDNEHYGETGNQPTHTGAGVDLAAVAGACGFPQALTCRTDAEVIDLKRRLQAANGATFAAIKVANRKDPLVLPPRDGAFLKHRFRTELLGRSA